MGYTHYFPQKRDFTMPEWKVIVSDMRALLNKLPEEPATIICGGMGTGEPEITDEQIVLNGDGAADLDHETFLLTRIDAGETKGFRYCKTAYKPYDILVCGILMLCELHAPGALEISSDGDARDWLPAVDWVNAVLGTSLWMPSGIAGAGKAKSECEAQINITAFHKLRDGVLKKHADPLPQGWLH